MTLITDKIQQLETPIDVMFLMHKVFLTQSEKASELAKNAIETNDLKEFKSVLDNWLKLLLYHYQTEDEFMTGPLKEKEYHDGRFGLRDNVAEHDEIRLKGDIVLNDYQKTLNPNNMTVQEILEMDDLEHLKVMDKISAVQNSIVDAFGAEKLKTRSLRGLYQSVLDLKVVEFDHFENEEAFVLTLVREQMTYEQQLQLTEKLLFDSTDQNENWIVDFLFSVLDDEESRLLQELISEIKG